MSDNNNMESGSTSIADDFRQRGNHEFQQQQYQNAVSFYTSALEHSNFEQRILNLCNRSACYYQMQDYELSLKDATTAWNVSRQMNVPAAIRLSKSAHKIGDLSTAITTLQRALRILTNDVQLYIQPNQTETAAPDRRVASQQQQQPPPQIQEASTNNTTTSSAPNASAQTKTVTQLLQQLQQEQQQQQNSDDTNQASTNAPETTIIGVHRPLSIREFTLSQDLGRGNFSEIIKVQHKVTGQLFALKKIAKKGAADLYKRQHPNVYNEIQMERRLLLERVNDDSGTTHRHPNIIQMYHAFQDYENLYYLMEFIDTDLWSTLRYSAPQSNSNTTSDTTLPIMLGCHRSLCKYWMYELIGAIEFLHSRGIVHRDLKTENILLKGNHVVVIDFGTAKDMVYTDLNGPEFVGTPDFMSPQAVNETETDFGTDLWALGAVLYQMIVGHTPYWSPSQYLAFLKIKRALHYDNLPRVTGIVEDDCWDFIHALMRADPRQRLGAGVFEMQDHVVVQGAANGYDCLRTHPYLQGIHEELRQQPTSARVFRNKATPVPSLWDCAVRATAEMAYRDSLDLDVCDAHPPGDGSKHDLLRLRRPERNAVLHVLDRRQLLGSEPRLYRRFFAKLPDYVRAATHDVVGLTQMNDDQGKAPKPHDPYSKFAKFEPIVIVQLSNPILCGDDLNEDTRKTYWKLLKRCIAAINKRRPHLVVVSGKMDDKIRKLLARISDTIPVVLHDGSTFLSAWKNGVQVICLNRETSKAQEDWLSEWLEQERMSKHPLFVFVDGNPHQLSRRLLKKLARGRALGLYGVSNDDPVGTELTYVANDTDDDGASIKSTDSNEEEGDEFTMNIQATNENGLRCITVNEEPDDWTSEFQRIELPVSE